MWEEFLRQLGSEHAGLAEAVGGAHRWLVHEEFHRFPDGDSLDSGARAILWVESDLFFSLMRHAAPIVQLAMRQLDDDVSTSADDVRTHFSTISVQHKKDVIGLDIDMRADQYVDGGYLHHPISQEALGKAHGKVDEVLRLIQKGPIPGTPVPMQEVNGFLLTPIELPVYKALAERELLFTPQCWVLHADSRRYRVDFMIYYGGKAFALEIDGQDFHKSKEQ